MLTRDKAQTAGTARQTSNDRGTNLGRSCDLPHEPRPRRIDNPVTAAASHGELQIVSQMLRCLRLHTLGARRNILSAQLKRAERVFRPFDIGWSDPAALDSLALTRPRTPCAQKWPNIPASGLQVDTITYGEWSE